MWSHRTGCFLGWPSPYRAILTVGGVTPSSGYWVESVLKQPHQAGIVFREALPGCVDHLVLRNARPVECVSIVECEFPNEFALRAAVAFTKRMDGIDLSQVVRSAGGKFSAIATGEIALFLESGKGLVEKGNDVCFRPKSWPTFAISTVRNSPAHA